MLVVMDLVRYAPVPTEPGAIDSCKLVTQSLTDPLRVFQQRSGNELNCGCGDLVR